MQCRDNFYVSILFRFAVGAFAADRKVANEFMQIFRIFGQNLLKLYMHEVGLGFVL
jgi:hypothetical protein